MPSWLEREPFAESHLLTFPENLHQVFNKSALCNDTLCCGVERHLVTLLVNFQVLQLFSKSCNVSRVKQIFPPHSRLAQPNPIVIFYFPLKKPAEQILLVVFTPQNGDCIYLLYF